MIIFFLDYANNTMTDDLPYSDGPIEYPINGTLDLHVFNPSDVHDLVPEYLNACRKKGILTVRIIHGKGTGTLRKIVHSVLEKIPWVNHYHLAGHGCGSWGVTIAYLDPKKNGD